MRDGTWDWETLDSLLSNSIKGLDKGMPTPCGEENNSFIQGPNKKGKFTMKSAYHMLAGIDTSNTHSSWKILWKWKVPNRVIHILWLAYHDRLMTNA